MPAFDLTVTLPGLGICTGTVDYDPGYAGTYWQPPEPAHVEGCALRDAFGILIPEDMIMENDEAVVALEAALGVYLSEVDAAEAQAMAEDWDRDGDLVAPF